MCLVCFINAEESRLKFPKDYCGTSASSVSEEAVDSSDDGSENDSLSTSHAIHYFAIGSMTNMTALALRELTPISSQPAILKGHRMLFRGKGGMATAEKQGDYDILECDAQEYPFDCIHGVLHLLSGPHMKILDDFEGGYKRRTCQVMLYDGRTEVSAYVYKMDRTSWKPTISPLKGFINSNNQTNRVVQYDKAAVGIEHELPTERYLDIIAQGCESHGVDTNWVAFVRSHACIPRKDASEFVSFSASMTSVTVPIIPWEQVRLCNGVNGAKLWIVINNKVLEFMGDKTSFFPCGYFIKHKIGGTDFTVKFAKGFFEPKYIQSGHTGGGGGAGNNGYSSFSSVTSSSQLGNEHRAWVEDQFAAPPPVLASSKWALVGVVDVSVPLSDPAVLTRNSTFGMRRTKLVSCRNPLNSSSNNNSSNVSPVASVGEGIADMEGNNAGICGTKRTPANAASTVATTEVLDLTTDINAGYNHFFISGTTSGIWIIPDGIHPGQTLYVRKTALEDFSGPVTIRIRNQSLSSPNARSVTYTMPSDVYYLSWCWDGEFWFLEQVGRAERGGAELQYL